MLKIVIFKVYLLRHLWTEVGFDYGLWIYRTISKIHRAGFFNFAFVFEIFDLELCERRYFVQTSNGCYSVTESRRVNLMVSIDRVANGLSQSINKSRVPRTTWLSRDLEHCRIATESQNRHFSKSISSAIYGRVSGLIMDYELDTVTNGDRLWDWADLQSRTGLFLMIHHRHSSNINSDLGFGWIWQILGLLDLDLSNPADPNLLQTLATWHNVRIKNWVQSNPFIKCNCLIFFR